MNDTPAHMRNTTANVSIGARVCESCSAVHFEIEQDGPVGIGVDVMLEPEEARTLGADLIKCANAADARAESPKTEAKILKFVPDGPQPA